MPDQRIVSAPAPGWYPDPVAPGVVRWWSGQGWTEHISAAYAPQQHDDDSWSAINLLVPRAGSLGTRSLIWGIVAILLPIAFVPAILALAFGAGGLARGNDLRRRGIADSGRSRAIVGMSLGAASLVLVVAGILVLASLPR